MGKAKRSSNKKKAPRPNPMNEVPPMNDEDILLPEETDESFIEGIICKLKSGRDEDRENGCESLCIAAERHVPRILETGLLRILSPLLLDPNQNVRRSAVGALKNLSLSSGVDPQELVQEMMKADVLTPLLALFQKLAGDIDDEEILVQGVQLLWNLCESSSVALERAFADSWLLEFLLSSLDRSPRVRVPLLQCLLTVSEDAPSVGAFLEGRRETLRDIVVSGSTPVQELILGAGILLNIMDDKEESELGTILEAINLTLEKDHRVMISDFSKMLPSKEEEEAEKEELVHSSDKSKMDTEESSGSEIASLLSAQETALEILTNLFCDKDEDDGDDIESFEEDEGIDSSGQEEGDSSYAPSISPVVLESLKREQLVDKVLQKAVLPPGEIIQLLGASAEGKPLLKRLKSLRSKAFLCLNNMLLCGSSSVELFSDVDRLFEVWTELGTLCFGEEGDESVLEGATSALRAITTRLVEARYEKFGSLSFQDLNLMCELGKNSPNGEVRLNLVHILGSLGSFHLGRGGGDVSKGLANYLLESASRDGHAGVCAEALDKIFDMFAEDETDELAVEVKLVPRMKGLQNGFKVKAGRLNKNEGAFPLVQTAKVNLNRFIKYKSKRPLISKSL